MIDGLAWTDNISGFAGIGGDKIRIVEAMPQDLSFGLGIDYIERFHHYFFPIRPVLIRRTGRTKEDRLPALRG